MKSAQHIATLAEILNRVAEAARQHDPVSIEVILETVGQRAFGPVLLLMGLVVLAPLIGDIPGVPTLAGMIVFLFSAQLMLNRRHFWLPAWLLQRSVSAEKLLKTLDHLRSPARVLDRLVRPRLTLFIRGFATHLVAAACMLIALAMPPMELVPFSANIAGTVLTLFGLALIGRDGVLALIGFALTAANIGAVVYAFV